VVAYVTHKVTNNNNNNNNSIQTDRQISGCCHNNTVIEELISQMYEWRQSMPAKLSNESAITVIVYTHHCCRVLFSPKAYILLCHGE